MADLVGTCPKGFWREWLLEGDPAGVKPSYRLYEWQTRSAMALKARRGDRFYIVAHGRLRGYAIVVEVVQNHGEFAILRGGGAVAVTLAEPIPGFRGLRRRWWQREAEMPFHDWATAGMA